jgi:hypothetical protein
VDADPAVTAAKGYNLMMKVEITIDTKGKMTVSIDILAREDANREEHKFCRTVEKIMIATLKEAAKQMQTEIDVLWETPQPKDEK